MKRILMISPIYPGNGTPKGYTPVVHYFTKEWVKMGYDVRVIHTSAYYPFFFYLVPSWLRKFIENKVGFVLPNSPIKNEGGYKIDGVAVYRVPLLKLIPQGKFRETMLKNSAEKIHKYLLRERFSPDVIIGHWVNPTIYYLSCLKNIYKVSTCLILHDSGEYVGLFPNGEDLLKSIDVWGYRSDNIKNSFEKKYGKQSFSFRCFSGIPSIFLDNYIDREWNRPIKNYVFVGQLIDRKHPDTVIKALCNVYGDCEYKLSFVGEGAMEEKLYNISLELGCERKVIFKGRMPRNKVIEELDSSDVFIMISHREVFGLVYLEAMSRGCITIAAKGEGMEGIIIDGYNGFLCEAGNENELIEIVKKIRTLSKEELSCISENSMKTARMLTDRKVAKDYIDTVLNFCYQDEDNKGVKYHNLLRKDE